MLTAKYYKSLCIVLFLCVLLAWILSRGDIRNAYIEADVDNKLIHIFLPKELFRDANEKSVIVEPNTFTD
jgi:hypothetical protein